jgi:hypothetical protein
MSCPAVRIVQGLKGASEIEILREQIKDIRHAYEVESSSMALLLEKAEDKVKRFACERDVHIENAEWWMKQCKTLDDEVARLNVTLAVLKENSRKVDYCDRIRPCDETTRNVRSPPQKDH